MRQKETPDGYKISYSFIILLNKLTAIFKTCHYSYYLAMKICS